MSAGGGAVAGVAALEVTVTAPVVSFRDPMYSAVALCLPCPPPATVGGMLAAAAGGWDAVPEDLTFGMAFVARGSGIDLETYHPLDHRGRHAEAGPRDRHFLAGATLSLWLLDDVELWRRRLRRPVWPLRLGRSQDLVAVTTRIVELRRGAGRQGAALVPAAGAAGGAGVGPGAAGLTGARGMLLQLPTAVSRDRARVKWDGYRYRPAGRGSRERDFRPADVDPVLDGTWVTGDDWAVLPLPPVHPVHAERRVA
jgi:CRISPR-associated Cas5-like protein